MNTKYVQLYITIYIYIYIVIYNCTYFTGSHETSPTAHRKVDGIEINIKVLYHLAIFVIIIEILIFAIVLMIARRNTPAYFLKHIRVGKVRGEVSYLPSFDISVTHDL